MKELIFEELSISEEVKTLTNIMVSIINETPKNWRKDTKDDLVFYIV